MNITTTYTTRANGSGIIVAKGGGKQKTASYDPSHSAPYNHGAAAGFLLSTMVKRSDRARVAASATHDDLGNGKHRFSVSL